MEVFFKPKDSTTLMILLYHSWENIPWDVSQHTVEIETLFTIAKIWTQSRCPSTDELIKTMWYIYIIKYYLDLNKDEIISFARKWLEPRDYLLRQIYYTLFLICRICSLKMSGM
jgi:hypothetical protein